MTIKYTPPHSLDRMVFMVSSQEIKLIQILKIYDIINIKTNAFLVYKLPIIFYRMINK